MFRTRRLAIGIGLALLACGSPPAASVAAAPPPAPPELESELPLDPGDADSPPASGHGPVQAGAYQLRMTATCPQQERTAKGRLTLKRISAAELPGGDGGGEVNGGDLLL